MGAGVIKRESEAICSDWKRALPVVERRGLLSSARWLLWDRWER